MNSQTTATKVNYTILTSDEPIYTQATLGTKLSSISFAHVATAFYHTSVHTANYRAKLGQGCELVTRTIPAKRSNASRGVEDWPPCVTIYQDLVSDVNPLLLARLVHERS